MTLRRILAISFLVACGLPLLVFWLWPHSRAIEAELEQTQERHLVLAQATAGTLELYQRDVEATFAAITQSFMQGHNLDFAYDLLKAQSFSHLCVVERETGRVIQSFQVAERTIPPILPSDVMSELSRRLESPSENLATIWHGAQGTPQFFLVQDLGEQFVFASLNAGFVQQMAESVSFGQRGHMAVIDASGRLIAHPNLAWAHEGKDLSQIPEIADSLEHNAPEVLVFYSPALGEDVVAGVAPVGETGWRVLVPQPVSEVRETVVAGRVSASLVFLSGLTLSALVAMFAAAIIQRPLKSLAQAADDMARGTERVVVGPISPLAPTEARILGASFDKMARRVEATLAKVSALAREDAATGLLNKRAFQDAAEVHLREIASHPNGMLLHVDVNNLKRVNDTYGHAVGDAAIASVGQCLRTLFPPPSLIGRVGGDEFLILTDAHPPSDLPRILQPLLNGTSFDVGNGLKAQTSVACSIGAAQATECHGDLCVLILHADEAMYYAKRSGRGYKLHDAEMKQRARRRTELAARLRFDVATDQVNAVFQPIHCATSGQIVSFETLARWRTKDHGNILPGEFLTIAHDIGIVSDLDGCVRRKAFAFARALRDQGVALPVAVNVTARDLAKADFMSRFMKDLSGAHLVGRDVIVEVTEAIFHDRYGLAMKSLDALAKMGVRIHLDDFGKGFSAHGLLPLFEFEAVKIDMRFADRLAPPATSAAIVKSLASLGTQLGLTVVLEGIETEQERDFARAIGADRLQGFFYNYPLEPPLALRAALGSSAVTAAE